MRDCIREEGQGCFLWSRDLNRGYRQQRSCPLDWPLLGIHLRDRWYVDTSVPFGIRNGALNMQSVTQAVIDIMAWKGKFAINYIDDLAGANASDTAANDVFDSCATTLHELGLEESQKKEHAPSHVMPCRIRYAQPANEDSTTACSSPKQYAKPISA